MRLPDYQIADVRRYLDCLKEGEARLKANNAVEQDLSLVAVQRRRVMMAKLADCIAKFEAWLAELE